MAVRGRGRALPSLPARRPPGCARRMVGSTRAQTAAVVPRVQGVPRSGGRRPGPGVPRSVGQRPHRSGRHVPHHPGSRIRGVARCVARCSDHPYPGGAHALRDRRGPHWHDRGLVGLAAHPHMGATPEVNDRGATSHALLRATPHRIRVHRFRGNRGLRGGRRQILGRVRGLPTDPGHVAHHPAGQNRVRENSDHVQDHLRVHPRRPAHIPRGHEGVPVHPEHARRLREERRTSLLRVLPQRPHALRPSTVRRHRPHPAARPDYLRRGMVRPPLQGHRWRVPADPVQGDPGGGASGRHVHPGYVRGAAGPRAVAAVREQTAHRSRR